MIYTPIAFTVAVLLLAAMWAGVSTRHWFFRASVVCGLLAALYPIAAYQPMIWFAIVLPVTALVSWSVTWMKHRQTQTSEEVAVEQRPRFQFRLTDCMLLVLLAGVVLAFSLGLRQQKIVFEWRLGVIVSLTAVIAVICLTVSVVKGHWRFLAVVGLLAVVGGCSELYARYLFESNMLNNEFFFAQGFSTRRLHGIIFFSVLAGMVVSVLIGCWLMSPMAKDVSGTRRGFLLLARTGSAIALTVVLIPMSVLYMRMAHGSPMPPNTYQDQPNSYVRAAEIVDQLVRLNPSEAATVTYRTPTTADKAQRLEQLQREFMREVRTPGHVSFQVEDSSFIDRVETQRARSVARMLAAEAAVAENANRIDLASEYALASIQFGNSLSRGGVVIHFLVGVAVEGTGMNTLLDLRDRLTVPRMRALISELQKIDQSRESVELIIARDAAFSDHKHNWVGRLLVALFPDSRSPLSSVRDAQLRRESALRMTIADLAVRCYQLENGDPPRELKQLVPDYLDDLPIDPHSGNPVLYQFNPAGQWVVYSVGSDGKDDGGVFGTYFDALGKPGYDLDLDLNRDYSRPGKPE